jgi:hypothetical protein
MFVDSSRCRPYSNHESPSTSCQTHNHRGNHAPYASSAFTYPIKAAKSLLTSSNANLAIPSSSAGMDS